MLVSTFERCFCTNINCFQNPWLCSQSWKMFLPSKFTFAKSLIWGVKSERLRCQKITFWAKTIFRLTNHFLSCVRLANSSAGFWPFQKNKHCAYIVRARRGFFPSKTLFCNKNKHCAHIVRARRGFFPLQNSDFSIIYYAFRWFLKSAVNKRRRRHGNSWSCPDPDPIAPRDQIPREGNPSLGLRHAGRSSHGY